MVVWAGLATKDEPDLGNRYGSPNLALKILWSLVALAMIVLGAIWTFAASGIPQSFGRSLQAWASLWAKSY